MTEPLHPALVALPERLSGPDACVAVIGLGYVGLPLSMSLAESGARVVGLDVNAAVCEALCAGRSHIRDIPDTRLQAANEGPGSFTATTDFARLATADAVIICVPTPLRKTKDPDISHIVAASTAVAEHARPGQLIILESTTYPGTTTELLAPRLQARGLEPGQHVAVAFSPERVDPGNAVYDVRNTPKVVGGITAVCAEAATALYKRCCDTVVPVSSTTAAEMVKLLENVFRSVNIGLVNEFALICGQLDVDVWEVIEAASTKPFGFMPFWPGPGLGGHCIPVDPHYLAWKLRSHNFTARFIELADAINSRMPAHVVSVVMDALNDQMKSLRGAKVLVLGVAYKPDISDVRESPALDVIELLEAKGARFLFHDPNVPSLRLRERVESSTELTDSVLEECDCALIVTHHSGLDVDRVLRLAPLVVDTRNATAEARGRHPDAVVRLL
jgi:UDP-N-acetyl-D-glucosamine dehydrogenase